MTSAVLLVALLVVVDLSYRRWMRRSIARRMHSARRADAVVVLDEAEGAPDAPVVALDPRDGRARDGCARDESSRQRHSG